MDEFDREYSDPIKIKKPKKNRPPLPPLVKRAISVEGFVVLVIVLAIFVPIGAIMGFGSMMNTLFNNASYLLTEVCFYLLGIAVIIGALAAVLTEFGVISIFNKLLAPLMKPIYGMPGATSMCIFTSFLSDNPAVLTLASDRRYKRYFKKYQYATLTNIGTSFGMGLLVTVMMLTATPSDGASVALAVGVGIIGSLIGSVVSTRLMLMRAKKVFGKDEMAETQSDGYDATAFREIREGGKGQRFIASLLDGGAEGVKVGFSIIPGVLIFANLVMLLNGGKGLVEIDEEWIPAFTGAAGEGVSLLPFIGKSLSGVFKVLFGFTNDTAISVPLTALGSAGAAMTIVANGNFTANEIAVFTAMCMFWSGYLSTHVAMMDSMGFRKLTGASILFHTIGGICAGICANFLYILLALIL